MDKKYYAYIIYSGNRTYNGVTNDLTRRLRQHNREIRGGAKATGMCKNWRYLAYIEGFVDKNNCLSCEWRIKHPDGKRKKNKIYSGINGRILTLNELLLFDKWTDKCNIDNNDCKYTLHIVPDYIDKLVNFGENITIVELVK